MGKDKIERLFNEELHSYGSEIDTDALWADISPRVDSKSKRKRKFFFIFLGLSIAMSFFLIKNQRNSRALHQVASFDSPINQNTYAESLQDDYSTDKTINDNPSNLITHGATNQPKHSNNKPNTNKLSLVQNESFSSSKTEVESNAESSTFYQTNEVTRVNRPTNTPTSKSTNDFDIHSESVSEDLSYKTSNPVMATTSNSLKDVPTQESIENTNTTNTRKSLDEQSDVQTPNRTLLNDKELGSSITFEQNPHLSFMNDKEQMYLVEFFDDDSEKPRFKHRRDGFSIGIELLPYYTIPLFKTNGSQESEAYKKLRNTAETSLEAFTLRTLGRYQWKNGLYGQGGIDYSQIAERLDYEEIHLDTIKGQVPTSIIISDDGATDTLFGEGDILRRSFMNAKIYNYHRLVDIHVGIGYEMPLTDRIGAYIEGNIGFNLISWHKGQILTPKGVFENVNKAEIFKNQLGIKLNTQFGITVNQGSIQYRIGPSVFYHWNNWLHNENLLEQRYIKLGGHVGLSYRF